MTVEFVQVAQGSPGQPFSRCSGHFRCPAVVSVSGVAGVHFHGEWLGACLRCSRGNVPSMRSSSLPNDRSAAPVVSDPVGSRGRAWMRLIRLGSRGSATRGMDRHRSAEGTARIRCRFRGSARRPTDRPISARSRRGRRLRLRGRPGPDVSPVLRRRTAQRRSGLVLPASADAALHRGKESRVASSVRQRGTREIP